jgi:hypothetical protein
MGTSLRCRIIQLKPRESKVPVIARRMQQELRNLTLRAGINSPSTDTSITRVIQRDCCYCADRLRPAVPSVLILVDRGWERRNVELVRGLS